MNLKKRTVIITEDSTQDSSIWFWHEMLSRKSEKGPVVIFIDPRKLIFKMTFKAMIFSRLLGCEKKLLPTNMAKRVSKTTIKGI